MDHCPPDGASHEIVFKLSHGLKMMQVKVPSDADFLAVKVAARDATGVPIEEQTLLFRGRPVSDGDAVYAAGVRNGSKLMLTQSEESRRVAATANQSLNQIAALRKQVDNLEQELCSAEISFSSSNPAGALVKESGRLQEMFERLLLKFDEVVGVGDVRDKRKEQVQRLQRLCERTENLKSKCNSDSASALLII
mmetsp:Transcript_24387/g.33593  ORF Transcript_24387/g.33593 Transcript_24387/m.33593 type:complete len:194 (-) Transcript_24387:127-708(-)